MKPLMKAMLVIAASWLSLAAASASGAAAPTPAAAPVRLAVLAVDGTDESRADPVASTTTVATIVGQDAFQPDRSVAAIVETGLFKEPGVVLVERQQIERILREHHLTAAGLVDARQRIALGKILHADVLLFIDAVPGVPDPSTSIRVTESASGVVLEHRIWPDDRIKADAESVRHAIRQGLAKRRLPLGERHVLGVVGGRSEESGHALDSTAEGLAALCEATLAASPGVVVLDRNHLEHLRVEQELTADERKLRASVQLLEIGVRRAAKEGRLTAVIRLNSMAGGSVQTANVEVPADNLPAAQREIVNGVLRLLGMPQPKMAETRPNEEAAAFMAEAQLWQKWGDPARAARAADVVYALNPTPSNRLFLARRLIETPSLVSAIRANRLLMEAYYEQSAAIGRGTCTNLSLPTLGYVSVRSPNGEDVETRALRAELVEMEDTVFRRQLQHYRTNYHAMPDSYWNAWQARVSALQAYHPGNPQKQLDLACEAVAAFLEPPERDEPMRGARIGILYALPRALMAGNEARYPDAETEHLFVPKVQEWTRHPDPFVRCIAFSCQITTAWNSRERAKAAARQILRVLLTDMRANHPYRIACPVERDLIITMCWAEPFGAFAGTAAEYEALIRDVLAAPQPRVRLGALNSFNRDVEKWLSMIAEEGKLEAALELTDRILETTKQNSDSATALQAQPFTSLKTSFARLVAGKPPAPETNSLVRLGALDWSGFSVQRLDLGLDFTPSSFRSQRSTFTKLFLLSRGDRLYAVTPQMNESPYRLRSTLYLLVSVRRLPDGGDLGSFKVNLAFPRRDWAKDSYEWRQVFYAAVLGDRELYVGTELGLVVIPLDGSRWRLLTEKEGLPGTLVRALGWMAGRLFLGIGSNPIYNGEGADLAGFASYDPETRRCTMIASERAVTRSNAWDGVAFGLDDILPDEARRCLWLNDRLTGIWKFTPSTGSVEQWAGPPQQHVITPLTRHHLERDGQFLPCSVFRKCDASFVPLPQFVNGYSVASHEDSYAVVCDGEDAFVSAVAYDGRKIRRVMLRCTARQQPKTLAQTPDGTPLPEIEFLHETDYGLLAVGAGGEAFLISRTPTNISAKLPPTSTNAVLTATTGKDLDSRLLLTTAEGRTEDAGRLIKNGANMESADGRGWTPLIQAIRGGHPETALMLLDRGANASKATLKGCTPLSFAAKTGSVSVAKALIKAGANPNSRSIEGFAPLHAAAFAGHLPMVTLLLEAGAKKDLRDNLGFDAFLYAAQGGHKDIVDYFLAHGASVTDQTARGWSVLDVVAELGHDTLVESLLKAGAELDHRNNEGWTPLMVGAYNGRESTVTLLLEKGAKVDSTNDYGWTALALASQKNKPGIVSALLAKGANVESRNQDGWTPIMIAAYHGNLAVAKELIRHEADVKAVNQRGDTALLNAARQQKNEMVGLLLMHEADSSE